MSPARSKNQAVAMNIAKAVKEGKAKAKPGSPSAQMADSMSMGQLQDFAGTPMAGLPQKAPAPPRVPKKVITPPAAPATPDIPTMMNVGGNGPGRPPMKVKNVGKPVKKMRF